MKKKFFYFKIDAFFIVLRRENSKPHALNFLKNLILNEIEVPTISYIFRNINEIFRKGYEDKFILF